MDKIVLKYGTDIIISNCETAWTDDSHGDMSVSRDNTDKKVGTYSMLADGSSGGLLCHRVLTTADATAVPVDIHTKTAISFWIKSSIAIAAGKLLLRLDDTADCTSPIETLAIPETPAGVWTLHTINLAVPASDTAIASVGLTSSGIYNGAVRLDQIVAISGYKFDAYTVRGFDEVDDLRPFPAIKHQLLDGSLRVDIVAAARDITVNFAPIMTKAMRTWLASWWIGNDWKLVYANEDLAVVPDLKMQSEWKNGVKIARAYNMVFFEKTPWTTLPAAMQ